MTKHKATDATPRDNHNALTLLANGDATMAEVARMAGVSRQAVAKWARAAGIDPVAARKAQLDRLWADERRELIGRKPPTTLTADELHRVVGRAADRLADKLLPKRKRLK